MRSILFLLLFISVLGTAKAQDNNANNDNVPRFVCLKTDETNLRTGPGLNYPIDWVYVKKNMPVEVIREFEHWRMIKDFEGTKGWIHRSGLSAKRYAFVSVDVTKLRKVPKDEAQVLAYLKKKVVLKVKKCPKRYDFCKVSLNDNDNDYEGWVRKSDLWGVYIDENF